MPVPVNISDLSIVAGSNSPAGGDPPNEGDNHIRALAAFIAQLRDKHNGTDTGAQTIGGALTVGGALTGAAATFSGLVTGAGAKVGNTAIADAATLDWYQEGTFTPAYSGSGTAGNYVAGSANTGRYTRVGDLVRLTWYSVMNVSAPGTGNLDMTLPFNAATSYNTFESVGVVMIQSFAGAPADFTACIACIKSGGLRLNFRIPIGSTLSLMGAPGGSNFTLSGEITYKAA